jgi:uncharacterized repeat protein (TIGR01451 family)
MDKEIRSIRRSTIFAWILALTLLSVLVIVPVQAGSQRLVAGETGSSLGEHAPVHPLATPPTMQWHTFMGGSSTDWGNSIALDGNGNVIVAGLSYTTWGTPTNAYAGGSDAFVAKLNSDGTGQWNTFLGSADDDDGNGIAADGSGNVYIVGTSSTTWGSPINPFAESDDAFVAKLNSDGALQWLTFLGGSGADSGIGIALDENGNVYIVGTAGGTWGTPINPHTGQWYDPFVAKLNGSGALQWHTYWGAGSLDSGEGIAVDGSSNVYAVGQCYATWASPVDAYAGGTDACVVKLDTNGTRQWNTFMGSSDIDGGHGIAVDGSGDVYVTGYSNASWDTPIDPHGGPHYDVFVARLNGSDGVRQWNTFMGFSGTSYGRGVAVDRIGSVYVVGDSKDRTGVFCDAFLSSLTSDGAREWNMFIGGKYQHDYGRSVVPGGVGHLYAAGHSQDSWGAPISSHSGGTDAFAVKFEFPVYTDVAITKSAQPHVTMPGETITYTLAFSNMGRFTATGVLITDTVPAALTNAGYTGSGAIITPTGSISYTWEVQNLASGDGGVITVTGIVSPGLEIGTAFLNTATIVGTETDINPDNDSSSVRVLVPSSWVFLPLVVSGY